MEDDDENPRNGAVDMKTTAAHIPPILEQIAHATDRLGAVQRTATEFKKYLALASRTSLTESSNALFVAKLINASLGVISLLMRDALSMCEVLVKGALPDQKTKRRYTELLTALIVLRRGLVP